MPAIVRKFICSRLRALSPLWRGALTCCRRMWRRQHSSYYRTVCANRPSNSRKSRSSRTITKTKMKMSRITKIILTMIITTRTTKIISCHLRHRPWITAMMTKMTMPPTTRMRTTKAMRTSSSRSAITAIWHRRNSLPISTRASACRRCCWIWVRTAMCAAAAASAA